MIGRNFHVCFVACIATKWAHSQPQFLGSARDRTVSFFGGGSNCLHYYVYHIMIAVKWCLLDLGNGKPQMPPQAPPWLHACNNSQYAALILRNYICAVL